MKRRLIRTLAIAGAIPFGVFLTFCARVEKRVQPVSRIDTLPRSVPAADLGTDGPTPRSLPLLPISGRQVAEGPFGVEAVARPTETEATLLRVLSPNTVLLQVAETPTFVQLAGVAPPSECRSIPAGIDAASFNAEAVRFLEHMLRDQKLLLETRSATITGDARVLSRSSDQKVINTTLIRMGYGCAAGGMLEMYCPNGWETHEATARRNHIGIWRGSPALGDGFQTESEYAARLVRTNLPR